MMSTTGLLVHAVQGGSSVVASHARYTHPSFLFFTLLLSFIEMCAQFNHVNSLSLIARAHQLVQEGYKYMFDEALATVWSAPNYCYRCGNMAAILTVREDGTRSFTVYGPAEENERDTAQQRTRRAVRCLFTRHHYLAILIRVASKGKFTVFCVGLSGCHCIDSSVILYPFSQATSDFSPTA